MAAPDDKPKLPKGKGKGRMRSSSPAAGGERKGICYAFRDTGKCDKGKECPYSHDRSPSPAGNRVKKADGSPRGSVICKYFAAGSCKFGDKCFMKHEAAAAPADGDGAAKPKGKGQGKGGQNCLKTRQWGSPQWLLPLFGGPTTM